MTIYISLQILIPKKIKVYITLQIETYKWKLCFSSSLFVFFWWSLFFTFTFWCMFFGSKKKTWSASKQKRKKKKKNKVIYPNPSRAIKLVRDSSRGENVFFGGGENCALDTPKFVGKSVDFGNQSVQPVHDDTHKQSVLCIKPSKRKAYCAIRVCVCVCVCAYSCAAEYIYHNQRAHTLHAYICIRMDKDFRLSFAVMECVERIALYSRWIHKGFRGYKPVLDCEKCL